MKNKLVTLFVLFITMSVLTASREDTGIITVSHPACSEAGCPDARNDYAVNLSCKESPAVNQGSNHSAVINGNDDELSLSPISRFILLQ